MPLSWSAQGIQKLRPYFLMALNMQDVTRNVLIAIMVVVAVINLITCLIILALERMRMIGILKAIGAGDWAVQRIFYDTAIITLSGIVAGVILALGILYLQVKPVL